jgi:uncharacterized delta-60 repeat protein
MASINQVLNNLNSYYDQITDLIPNLYSFIDEPVIAIDEFDVEIDDAPLGDVLYRLSNGKLLWGGISGGGQIGGYNIRRYNTDYTLDTTFDPVVFDDTENSGYVRDIGVQSDGKIIVVGHFTSVNDGTTVGRIMRLNADGTLDATFNTGESGFNSNAICVKVLSDDKILIGGLFNSYNGSACERIIKLNSDGSVDGTFTPEILDSDVLCLEVASNGDIYVGGHFSNRIIRLNSDGTLDSSFDVGTGFDNRVQSIKIDSNGLILVGGWFNSYNGSSVNQVVRLTNTGVIDGDFELDGPFDTNGDTESVMTLGLQSNGKILVGGWFWTLNGNSQSKLVRLNSDGSKDNSFDIGLGFNLESNWWSDSGHSRINHLLINTDGSIIVTGNIQGYQNSPINGFARLSSTGVLFESDRLIKYKASFGINDGSNDMYDSGNSINTNLTQLFDSIKEDNVDFLLSIPNTHTTANDDEAFLNIDNGNLSDYIPLKDGVVKSGTDYFGSGSNYFTNMYPGMFVMAATGIDIEEFSITGDLGSDGSTDLESSEIEINGSTYACFMKTNIQTGGNDPTVNHIILVPGTEQGLTHLVNQDGDDYDDDCVQGLTGRNHIYYILFSTMIDPAEMVSFELCQEVAEKFLEIVSIPEEVAASGCSKTCTQNSLTGFGCKKTSSLCGCAKMRYFYPNCRNIFSGLCSGRSGAYVPAITVCNQKLF